MQLITDALNRGNEFEKISAAVRKKETPLMLWGASDFLRACFCFALCEKHRKKALVIVSATEQNRVLFHLKSLFGDGVTAFPQKDFEFRNIDTASHDEEMGRQRCIDRIISGEYTAVVATAESLMRYIADDCDKKESRLLLKKGEDSSFEKVCELLSLTYTRCDRVEAPGQYAVRGGIADFFPVNTDLPYRVEFFGDEPDIIGQFDIESQRRINELSEVTVTPACEYSGADLKALGIELKKLAAKVHEGDLREQVFADAEKIENGISPAGIDKYIPLMHKKKTTLFDLLHDCLTFVFELSAVKDNAKGAQFRLTEDIKALAESGMPLLSGSYALSAEDFLGKVGRDSIIFERLSRSENDIKLKSLQSVNSRATSGWRGNTETLAEDIRPLVDREFSVLVCSAGLKHSRHLCDELSSRGIKATFTTALPENIPGGTVTVCNIPFDEGFELPSAKFAVFADGGNAQTHKKGIQKRRHSRGADIKSLNDLKKGDYIVHNEYGIGIFDGIVTTTRDGITSDSLRIKYAGTDILYVPCARLDLVSKLSGVDVDDGFKLNKLGKNEFQKVKNRVKSEVKELAAELIKLYAERLKIKGFAFSGDTTWQTEFEENFEFEETEDQLTSINEIKKDMESSSPMDRLLCGDVGVGKTEVAFRAAFKAVADNKQVAILVPTTVLAWQHYRTALTRFAGYPISIEMISRFRTPKQQRDIVKKVAKGQIDIIIGTHRLLQKDISFKDLGLAIVDEEQRFGVTHKERLKEMTKNVDVLTLSATPIPRTLNMALTGIRDLSVIEEPPQDRHPIQTYVAEFDYSLVADAITKELGRGGQVYYMHNRVESIYGVAHRLSELVPEARIGVGHGKMSESELSGVWESLLKHDIDVLVSTTIIETGVDVSNANTIIIEDADRLGLSQLHQIRGRVGRSSRKAYAYLLYKKGKVLSEDSAKRLTAIREFAEFGAGFKIAMRDLEIRGAGSVLGARQHGHIAQVGYDMYVKILNEVITEEKGGKPNKSACNFDLAVSAYIPESYIPYPEDRIDIYKKISTVENRDDVLDITDELIDRFSDIPAPVNNLIKIAYLKSVAAGLNITEITEKNKSLLIYTGNTDLEFISRLSSAYKGNILYSTGSKPYFTRKLRGQNCLASIEEFLNIYTSLCTET